MYQVVSDLVIEERKEIIKEVREIEILRNQHKQRWST